MVNFPWPRRNEDAGATFKRLDSGAGLVLDVEGNKAVALKLPSNVAKAIAGQASPRVGH